MAQKNNGGFTIIEVMIVLVIAAVIVLMVFLAVPALQRNSRNNQRKNDASRLLAAAQEWRATNNNQWPTVCLGASGTFLCGSSTDRDAIANLAGKLASADSNNSVGVAPSSVISGNISTSANIITSVTNGNIFIITQASCTTNGTTIASGNGFAVIYGIEQPSSTVPACI